MDGNIGRALWIGIGVLFFIAVVSLGLSLLDQGRDIASEQSTQLAEVQQRLSESEFSSYDNQEVAGTQVMSALRGFKGDSETLAISVTTKKSHTIYLNTATISAESVTLGAAQSKSSIDQNIKNARDASHVTYINPLAKFESRVIKDQNGVIGAITFTQK